MRFLQRTGHRFSEKKKIATDHRVFAMENALILQYQSNDPEIGYNGRAKYRAPD